MTAAKPILIASAALLPGALHAAAPHSGVVVRHGFTLSDLALFGFAAVSIWLARRSMRARARARAKD